MSSRWRGFRAAGLGALFAVSYGLVGCRRTDSPEHVAAASSDAATPHAGPLVRVDASLVNSGRVAVAPTTRRALRVDVRVPAEIVPSESGAADVGALIAGRIGSIEVREGDTVKRGQVLAWVESPEAARAAADFIRTRARAFAAARKLERQLGLEQDKATSAASVDEARVELATAEADSAAARTLLTSLGIPEPPPPAQGVLAARAPVRSPIEGVVVERMIALGAHVSPEKTLFRVLARERVVVEARWTDTSAPAPDRDAAVKLLPRSGDGRVSCNGRVVSTLSVVDERTRARRVRINPDGPCSFLVPGSFVDALFTSAELPASEAHVLAVPKEAVVDVRGAPTVFVAQGATGVFAPRAVHIDRTTADDISIADGLAEGDLVVVVGAVLLKGELLRAELESQ